VYCEVSDPRFLYLVRGSRCSKSTTCEYSRLSSSSKTYCHVLGMMFLVERSKVRDERESRRGGCIMEKKVATIRQGPTNVAKVQTANGSERRSTLE